MAREKALFHGHPIAAIAAISEKVAAEALKLIEVEYEVLPWVIDAEDAIKPDAPILHDFIKFDGKPSNIAVKLEHKLGDIDKGFAEAEVVVERSFRTAPVHQGYIETHACLVSVADGKATVWSSSQGQFMVRAMCSYLTGLPQSDIRAIPAEIGGGFGGKTIVYLEPVALLLAKKSGRPVKMVMTREEVMRATGPTSGSFSTVKIGAKKDGTIVAAQGTFYLQAGALPCTTTVWTAGSGAEAVTAYVTGTPPFDAAPGGGLWTLTVDLLLQDVVADAGFAGVGGWTLPWLDGISPSPLSGPRPARRR
jgi:CO/xanthine dehydrogenase Mo-binding subunit